MSGRCTGDCCRRFPLSVSPEEMRADLQARETGTFSRFDPVETRFVLDMVIPIEVSKIRIDGTEAEEPRQYYTCRHLQPSGDCGAYENRPRMCSDFPHYGRGSACEHVHCQWEDGKNPPIAADRLIRGEVAATRPGRIGAVVKSPPEVNA